MKQEILDRIQLLGGNIDNAINKPLLQALQAITFNTVLYPKPKDTPWQIAEEAEPVYGIAAFINEHAALFQQDKTAFYKKIIAHYYVTTEEGRAQVFFRNDLFTPLKAGTADYDEWNSDFNDPEMVDLHEVVELTGDTQPDFIQIAYSYGFPDHYYVCLSDPDQENPTVFGTDHEVFFKEITSYGNLETFFNNFLTPDELVAMIRKRLEK
ncbi:hypothetical protein [Chitinophaga nivalis]|uniref:SMI1/KNR4 family protein n=1 Tax=Chitinophaga nivalis TaxID=2991709 RepID=A0ABT3IET3_9BACT|nr:hypothetical protein [Chitinophaga nivalis]MCW3467845.1 hypothetical protein [Chitinophaga nivalis]MCW3482463.1 hypothetical protein [Chitinophaga nivalis]